jgi:TPR repeat protein
MSRLEDPTNKRVAAICLLAALLFNTGPILATTEPLVSPVDTLSDNELPQESAAISPNYDPCATTAYGEPLYFEENSSVFFQVVDVEAEYQRARMAFLFGNYDYAYKLWEPLAYQGYAKAQATLAWMFHTGKGVSKNMQRALAWYRVAADQDHPIAQNNLGVFYEQGIEVGKSYRTAAKWYQKAAEVGYPYAQYNLGVLFLNGKGVKKDKDEAIYWLQIASLQGVKQATLILEKLGQQAAPKDETHQVKSKPTLKKRYHGAPLPVKTPEENKDATWIVAQNPQNYTLHLAASYNLPSLISVAQAIPNQTDVAYYQVAVRGKNWFTLIYGSYENADLAKQALEKLPQDIKKWSPVVRQFSELQKTLSTD